MVWFRCVIRSEHGASQAIARGGDMRSDDGADIKDRLILRLGIITAASYSSSCSSSSNLKTDT